MPKTNEIIGIRLEQTRSKLHGVYAEAIKQLGGEDYWSEEDVGILELIDARLFEIANSKVERIEAAWQSKYIGQGAWGTINKSA
jgi:hypothetical protein